MDLKHEENMSYTKEKELEKDACTEQIQSI